MITIMGDTHGFWGDLNHWINHNCQTDEEHNIIVVGDFGYWPNSPLGIDIEKGVIDKIKPGKAKIYFVPGNHEHYALLEAYHGRYGKEPIAIDVNRAIPQIYYCPFGSYAIIEGRKFFFIGGADSIDKYQRKENIDWFSQEVISQKDMFMIDDMWKNNYPQVDIMVSHTCPHFILEDMFAAINKSHEFYLADKAKDPTCFALDYFAEKVNPKMIYFGHWHTFAVGTKNGVSWMALDYLANHHGKPYYYKIIGDY